MFDEDWYDPENQPRVDSHEDRCSFGVGVGFVHFDVARNDEACPTCSNWPTLTPDSVSRDTGRRLPSEIDLTCATTTEDNTRHGGGV